MDNFDFIVIGSGISGSSFAHHTASAGKKVLVLEKNDTAGGCLRSLTYNDFWLEMGGHTIYNSYQTFIQTLRELGMEDSFVPRGKASFRMFSENGLSPLMKHLSKFELMMNVPKMFFMKKPGKTVREYYSAVLGKGNYENTFSAMLQAVISQDASDFPADMLLKKRDRDKTAPRNFTLKNGMASFIAKACENENITLKTDSEAVDITFADGRYTVETIKGEKYTSDNITMACPPPVAGKLLKNFAPDASEVLMQIKGAKVETFSVVMDKKDIEADVFSFIIAKDGDFYSAVSRDVLPHDKYRGVSFHFAGGKLTKEEKISRTEDVLGTDRGAFLASAEAVHFSPTLGMDHKECTAKLEKAVKVQKGLYIVGNYFSGLAIEDCAQRAKTESVRAL